MSKPSLVDNAVRAIKQDIVCGRLAAGCPIKVKELSAAYGCGATPIREALNQLAATGMVSAKLNCGFSVPEFNAQNCDDLFDIRFLLEPVVIKSSLKAIDSDWEESLLLLQHRLLKADSVIDKVFAERNLYLHLFASCQSDIMLMAISAAYDCSLYYYYNYLQKNHIKSARALNKLMGSLVSATASKRADILKHDLITKRAALSRSIKRNK
jgi:GntR family transcriptional regulator, carbon starvation induced regulator